MFSYMFAKEIKTVVFGLTPAVHGVRRGGSLLTVMTGEHGLHVLSSWTAFSEAVMQKFPRGSWGGGGVGVGGGGC